MYTNNKPLDLPSSLGFVLNRSAKLMAHALSARLKAHELTPVQLAVLSTIVREPGIAQKEVAERTGVDTASLAELVRRLEGRGLIRRDTDPQDSRRVRVHPGAIEAGRLRAASDEARAVNAQALRGFKRHEVDTLMESLRRVRANLTEDA